MENPTFKHKPTIFVLPALAVVVSALSLSYLPLQVLACILVADFVSGVGHWLEDAYGDPSSPFFGSLIKNNIDHHRQPRAFLQQGVFPRNKTLFVVTAILAVVFTVVGYGIWQVYLTLGLLAFINEFHAYSHRTDKETPQLVRYIQKTGFIQSRKHHGWHHKSPFDVHYCILTAWLNPVFDYIHFWDNIERGLYYFFKIKPIRATGERDNL